MTNGIEHIGKKDVVWSYLSTLFTVGAGILLLPFILNQMNAETIGIWNVFQTITALVLLLDFGFRPSFARNISYILSGVRSLQANGVANAEENQEVNYGLLSGTIDSMRKFYMYVAGVVLALLLVVGTPYFLYILQKYSGNRVDAIVAWIILCCINCYTLYTFYYDALLTGKGYIKRTQQMTIIGQATYIVLAIGLIYAGLGLTAIVSAQLVSTIIRRIIAYRTFYTPQMKQALAEAPRRDTKPILQATMPNAIKIGLTNIGSYLINQSSVLLGSMFLTLEEVAMYGITLQVVNILGRCGTAYYQSHIPNLAKYRVERNYEKLRHRYMNSTLSLLGFYIIGGIIFLVAGNWALGLLRSGTSFLPTELTIALLVVNFLEHNHAMAAGFIMADNKIPFFIPSIVSGIIVILTLVLMLKVWNWGIWALILAPGLTQLAYQNWKWPSVVISELWSKR